MRPTITFLGLILAAAPTPLTGQWRVGLSYTQDRISGGTGPAPGAPADAASFRPWQPAWLGLQVQGPWRGIRPALGLRFGRPDLALEAAEVTIVEHSSITGVAGLTADAMVPVVALREGVRLDGALGVLIERWVFRGEEPRVRAGPSAGVDLAVGLGGRVEGVFGLGVSVLPTSIFEPEELPERLEPRSVWRRSLRGLVRLRL